VTVQCWRAAGAFWSCHWVSCHAHDNDNDIKWGSCVAHMSTYMGSKRIAAMDTGLSKPRPGDRSSREVGAIRLPASKSF